jgi:hypothetical protein
LGKAEAKKRPMTGGARRPHRHRLDEPRHRLPRPRPGAQRIDGRTIDVDDDPPSGRMVRYAAIGRRRHGPLCCRRANGALRFVLTIDYGPSLPPTEIITRGLIDPILTRWGASERLPWAEKQCAVRLQLMSGLVRIAAHVRHRARSEKCHFGLNRRNLINRHRNGLRSFAVRP